MFAGVPARVGLEGARMSQLQQWLARRTWHSLVWLLIFTAGWDAFGMLAGGDRWFTGASYDVLRLIVSRVGGMRALGVPLGLICLSLTFATLWSYGRHSAAGRRPTRAFPLCLSMLAGWYMAWLAAIAYANIAEYAEHRSFLGWTSVSKLAFVAVVAVIVACLPPPPPAPYWRCVSPAVRDGGNHGGLSG